MKRRMLHNLFNAVFSQYLLAAVLIFSGMIAIPAFSTETVYAQQLRTKRNITGYVKDAESGEALPSANVVIKGTYTGAATNVDGYFVLINVPAVLCTLQVSYLGYSSKEVEVDNSIGNRQPLIINLIQTPFRSEEVVVTANVQMVEIVKEPGQVIVSPQQLFTLPNIGEVDIFRSLQLLPGISAADDGSSGLYVRGGTPDQNLILLDGMKIYHVDHFFGFFSAFNADAIKDIRLYKGGFPAEYGGRISSVVDLTGKTGNMNNTSVGMGANLLSAHAVIEIPVFKNGTWILTSRRSYTDYIRSPLYNSIYGMLTGEEEPQRRTGGFRQRRVGQGGSSMQGETSPDFYFYDLNSKFTWTPTEKDIVSFSFYNGKDNLDKSQDFSGIQFRSPGSNNADATMQTTNLTKWGNTGTSMKWSRHWVDRLYSHFLLAHSTYFSNYDRSSSLEIGIAPNETAAAAGGFAVASEEDNKVEDLTFRFDNELHLTNSHNVKIGVELSQFNARYTSTLNDTTELFSRKTEAQQNSVYIQDNWRVFNTFEIKLGLRGTHYNKTGNYYIEPRASFVYEITKQFNIKGAWGKFNQFVSRITNENVLEGSRDFWLLADKDLKPGYAEHSILGISYKTDGYLLDIEGYRKNLDNLMEYTRRFRRAPGSSTPFFMGTGIAEGIDFLLQKKRGNLTGWAGYTLSKVEYDFPGLNNGNPFLADHDRTHEIKLVGTLSKGSWNFAATWVYATGRAYTSPESQYNLTMLDGAQFTYIHVSDKNANRLPSYQRLDLSVSRRFDFTAWYLDFGGSIFNAYNHKNVWYKEYNLDASPIVITDMMMLGFTPTLYFRFQIK